VTFLIRPSPLSSLTARWNAWPDRPPRPRYLTSSTWNFEGLWIRSPVLRAPLTSRSMPSKRNSSRPLTTIVFPEMPSGSSTTLPCPRKPTRSAVTSNVSLSLYCPSGKMTSVLLSTARSSAPSMALPPFGSAPKSSTMFTVRSNEMPCRSIGDPAAAPAPSAVRDNVPTPFTSVLRVISYFRSLPSALPFGIGQY